MIDFNIIKEVINDIIVDEGGISISQDQTFYDAKLSRFGYASLLIRLDKKFNIINDLDNVPSQSLKLSELLGVINGKRKLTRTLLS